MRDDWGLTNIGYYCPTFEELLEEKIKYAKELFGEDIATSGFTPLGKLLRIEAADHHKLYEEQEKLYYSMSPVTASGISLDRLCSIAGIKRNPAVCAVHRIRVYGVPNTIIKAGTLFRSPAGVKFYAISDCVINEFEGNINDIDRYYADVTVQCTDAGTVGNVYNISAPVMINENISDVDYFTTIRDGHDIESDHSLRSRYNIVINGTGVNTVASIIAGVLKIPDVYNCTIINNTSDEPKEISEKLTISPGTYGVIVYGGESVESKIAEAIYTKMPFGVKQSGVSIVAVQDEAGENHNIRFTYVDEKSVDITVKCYITDQFTDNGISTIRDNIKEYINNLDIGECLIYSKLFHCIYSVEGIHSIEDVKVNDDQKDIAISATDIIKCGNINIEITEV